MAGVQTTQPTNISGLNIGAVSQAGDWIISAPSLASITGLVDIKGIVSTASINGIVAVSSLPSLYVNVTNVVSLASITGLVQLVGLSTSRSNLISLSSAGIAQRIPSSELTLRKNLTVYNASATTWWITQSSGASGFGIPVDSGEKMSFDSQSDIHVVPVFNGQLLSYLELS